MTDQPGTQLQHIVGHFRAKVGHCPFCRRESAELWYEPDSPDFRPFQVRCRSCGAAGPWADCGWESAVPAWQRVVSRASAEASPAEDAATRELMASLERELGVKGPGAVLRKSLALAKEALAAASQSQPEAPQ